MVEHLFFAASLPKNVDHCFEEWCLIENIIKVNKKLDLKTKY